MAANIFGNLLTGLLQGAAQGQVLKLQREKLKNDATIAQARSKLYEAQLEDLKYNQEYRRDPLKYLMEHGLYTPPGAQQPQPQQQQAQMPQGSRGALLERLLQGGGGELVAELTAQEPGVGIGGAVNDPGLVGQLQGIPNVNDPGLVRGQSQFGRFNIPPNTKMTIPLPGGLQMQVGGKEERAKIPAGYGVAVAQEIGGMGLSPTDPASYTKANVQKALQNIKQRGMDIQAAGGPAAQMAQMQQGFLTDSQLKSLVDPETLAPFPFGTTQAEAKARGAISVTPKQRENFAALASTEELINQVQAYADRLIVAEDATTALQQGFNLQAGATTKSNTLAAAYADSVEGALGVLAKSIGGQSGVLTDKDIDRVRGMMPRFRDTRQIKDLKMGLFRRLYETEKSAQLASIRGRSKQQQRRTIAEIFAEADALNAAQNPNAGLTDEQLMESLRR